ncbi:MAG: hypothetical protein UZ21_OP11001000073 [Microgenomates bacterium OLB22]|nr:MAG: hypothetical protein UZ21_OP11001000073 [Microgenomates bacterium OLB22]
MEKRPRIAHVVARLKEFPITAVDYDVYEQANSDFLRELQSGNMPFEDALRRSSELKFPTESYCTKSAWELYKCLRCSGHDRIAAYRLVRHEQAHAAEARTRGYEPYYKVFFTKGDNDHIQMYLQTEYVVTQEQADVLVEDFKAIVGAPPTLSPDDKKLLGH